MKVWTSLNSIQTGGGDRLQKGGVCDCLLGSGPVI